MCGKKWGCKVLAAIIFAVILFPVTVFAAENIPGSDLTWDLSEDGVLTIYYRNTLTVDLP